jgi:hypothetical protein
MCKPREDPWVTQLWILAAAECRVDLARQAFFHQRRHPAGVKVSAYHFAFSLNCEMSSF